MEARSGQNNDNKIVPQANLIPLHWQLLWTYVFLSSLNNTFFSVLVFNQHELFLV